MMRTLLAATTATMVLAGTALGQKPDFSGSWKLNTEKSDPPPQMGGMAPPIEMFITQLTSRMTIDLKFAERNRTMSYNLDGSESRNPGMMGADFVTTSTWADNAILTKGKNTFKTPMGEMTVETTEIRSLSDDGKMMTIEMTTVSPRGTMKRKMVYDKQ